MRAVVPPVVVVLGKEPPSLSCGKEDNSLHLTSFGISPQTLTFFPQGEAAFPSAASSQTSPHAGWRRGLNLPFCFPNYPQLPTRPCPVARLSLAPPFPVLSQ